MCKSNALLDRTYMICELINQVSKRGPYIRTSYRVRTVRWPLRWLKAGLRFAPMPADAVCTAAFAPGALS
jgi:hypothetical protein